MLPAHTVDQGFQRQGLDLRGSSHIVQRHTANVFRVGRERRENCLKAPLAIALHVFLRIGVRHIRVGGAIEVRKERLAIVIEILIIGNQLQAVRCGAVAHQCEISLQRRYLYKARLSKFPSANI